MNNTAETLLALSEDELALEAAKVLTPGPYKHEPTKGSGICKRCGVCPSIWCKGLAFYDDNSCRPPDPITLDWNTAMKLRDKMVEKYGGLVWEGALGDVEMVEIHTNNIFVMDTMSQPRHYIIAAILAAQEKK